MDGKKLFRGEPALALAVLINSFGVVLMLYSGAGISAISSVPYAFSRVLPQLSLGTWTYIFQGALILSLMIMRKRFVLSYLFPRELADITKIAYPKIKIGFDVTCLAVTAGLTFFCMGHIDGLGIGTVAAAFTMGKGVGIAGDIIDKQFYFKSVMSKKQQA